MSEKTTITVCVVEPDQRWNQNDHVEVSVGLLVVAGVFRVTGFAVEEFMKQEITIEYMKWVPALRWRYDLERVS